MITTGDAALAARLRSERAGIGRMSEFSAALGQAGLPLTEAKIERRNQLAERYAVRLSSLRGISLQKTSPGDLCTFNDFAIHVQPSGGVTRDHVLAALRAARLPARTYAPLLHQQAFQAFRSGGPDALRNAEEIAGGLLLLPVNESTSAKDVDRIAEIIGNQVNPS